MNDPYNNMPDFDGTTYERKLDHTRLTTQLQKVRALMSDGRWRTLSEISKLLNIPEASTSSRLRDLRKEKFGGLEVERKRNAGTFYYKLCLQADLFH